MIFLLSLAGIPPLAGFFGKFYLFKAGLFVKGGGAASLGLLWLVILALVMSAVSLYYYLQVLKQAFVADAPPDAVPLPMSRVTGAMLILLAAAVLLLGLFPNLFVQPLLAALSGGQ
jgi:NADH-quinone oxidoreductase subunit N